MTGRGGETITLREALRLLCEADCYPRIGNEDWRVADRMKDAGISKMIEM